MREVTICQEGVIDLDVRKPVHCRRIPTNHGRCRTGPCRRREVIVAVEPLALERYEECPGAERSSVGRDLRKRER
jgi:hypothetical protein